MRNWWERLTSEEWLLRLVFLAVIAVYLRSIFFDYVYDDHVAVMNPWLTSWSGIKQIFTQHSWAWTNSSMFPARHFRPLFLLWLSAPLRIAGPAPGWLHLWSLLTHLAAVYLAFLLAKRLLGDGRLAAICAILFALHPSKVEGVVWISSFEPLLAVFFFGSVLSYIRARERSQKWWAWTVATFALTMAAVLSKETAIVLPGIFFAYEVFVAPGRERREKVRNAFWPMVAGVGAIAFFLLIRMRVLGGVGDEVDKLPITTTLFTVPMAFWLFVRQLLWPVHLSAIYPTTLITQFSVMRVALPALAMVVVAALCWKWAQRSPILKFAAAWYLLTLLPVLGLFKWVQLHERHLYSPIFAVALATTIAVSQIRWPSRIRIEDGQACLAVLLVLVLSLMSARELPVWDSDRTVFSRAVEVAPLSAEAADLLAGSYDIDGDYEKAAATWEDGLRRMPNDPRLSFGLGSHFYALGQYGRALPYLERLGNSRNPVALYELGLTESKLGMKDRALAHLKRAADLVPNSMGYRKAWEGICCGTTNLVLPSESARSSSSR